MKKLLAEFVKQIQNEVPFENRKLTTELVVKVARKAYGVQFTDKTEANFREQALFE